MDECYSYGSGHGCDLGCPKLLRGECEITNEVVSQYPYNSTIMSILDKFKKRLKTSGLAMLVYHKSAIQSLPLNGKILYISSLKARIPRLMQ